MSPSELKGDLITAREQLFVALDRYTELCSKIRKTHHQDTQLAGFPWSEVASELPFLPLLEAKLQAATQNLHRAHELGRARTSSTYPPPIHKLPDEVLAQIFRIAAGVQLRDLHPIGKHGATTFPSYSDSIAQTCGRWRQIALECSPLWMHICLAPHPTQPELVFDRAKSCAQRAGQLPVQLRITDLEGQVDLDYFNKNDIQEFFGSIAQRTKSLDIVRSNSSTSQLESEGLTNILRGCSEMFTRLIVRSQGLSSYGFIEPLNEPDEEWPGAIQVDLPLQQIERGLAHLTVLHASQIYPRWNSTAYHGLVDLRLISNHRYTYECPRIKPTEFVAILNASPRLRILHFGLNLNSNPDLPINGMNVQLNDLEVLHLAASRCYGPEDTEYEIQRIMRHITPGSKPLCLTLDLAGYHDPGPIETMKAFFAKSHIVQFRAKQGNPPPVQLLDHASHLTHLVFDHCRYDMMYDYRQARSQTIKLDSWIIRESPIYIEDLQPLLEQYSARSIIISNCQLFSKEGGPVEIAGTDLEEWGLQLPEHVVYVNPDQPATRPTRRMGQP
ncbi:F-box-like domain protein, partial [Rhizoctonia solani AG-3 Rhs1AP]